MKRYLGLLILCFPMAAAELRPAIEAYVAAHRREIFSELISLLSIPNVAADRENVRKNADRLRQMLRQRGLESEILETQGNPLVYGEKSVAGAKRTAEPLAWDSLLACRWVSPARGARFSVQVWASAHTWSLYILRCTGASWIGTKAGGLFMVECVAGYATWAGLKPGAA